MNKEILNSAAISEGEWVQTDGLAIPFSVQLYGFAAGDVAQIYVSNLYAKPAAVEPAAGDGTKQYGADISADEVVEITASYRWTRARKSVAGAAPATTVARIQGRER
jgi:hypothetical protein